MTTEDDFEKLKAKILDAVGEVLYVRANYPEYIELAAKDNDAVVQIRNCLAEMQVVAHEFQSKRNEPSFLIHSNKNNKCVIM